jgi:hypothetical protein
MKSVLQCLIGLFALVMVICQFVTVPKEHGHVLSGLFFAALAVCAIATFASSGSRRLDDLPLNVARASEQHLF